MRMWKETRFFSYRAVLVILLFFLCVGLFILKTSTLPAQEKCRFLKKKHSSMLYEVHSLREESRMLVEEINALRQDPFYVELVAREYLNMRGTGEEFILPRPRAEESGVEMKRPQ